MIERKREREREEVLESAKEEVFQSVTGKGEEEEVVDVVSSKDS